MDTYLGCFYLGLLWIKLLWTLLYSVLQACALMSIWYILGVKFLGYHIIFCLDGCDVLLAAMPAAWCQPPNLGTRPYIFSQSKLYPFQNLLRKHRRSSVVFRVESSLPGLAFKNPHNSLSTSFPHAYFLHFCCSLGADHSVSSILGSCRTELREHHLPGLRNPWQCLAHSGIPKCLPNGQSILIMWDSYS